MSDDKKCLDHESLFGYMNKHNVLCIVDKCFPEQPPKATVTPCKFSLSRGIPRYISVFLRDKADTKFIEMTSLCVAILQKINYLSHIHYLKYCTKL